MFSIPHIFANENENYITLPALKRFAKEKRKNDLKTTVDRAEIISDIEKYAQISAENEEIVSEWLDQVIIEGIKDVQIKYLNLEYQTDLLFDDEYLQKKLELLLKPGEKRHLTGLYTKELKLFRYQIVQHSSKGRSIKLYLGKLLCTFDKNTRIATTSPYPIFVEIYVDQGIIVTRAKSKSGLFKNLYQ